MRSATRIPTTAQIRKLEAEWIATCNADWGQVLMEIAGRDAAQVAYRMWIENPGEVAIFCGRGNNGGDGMVIARYLTLWGLPVSVYLVVDPAKSNGNGDSGSEPHMSTNEANNNMDILSEIGVDIAILQERPDAHLAQASLVVDALLGTGIDRPVEGLLRHVIESINGSAKAVLAIDLPSGINSDTGQIMGVAIRADQTVTFGYLKPGLLCYPGADLAGALKLVDIGLPQVTEATPEIQLCTGDFVRSVLPLRPTNSHKGSFGSLLCIAGSLGMSGATLLAAESALRAGVGLCVLATPKSLLSQLPPKEVIYKGIAETPAQSISSKAIADLEAELEKATGLVLGPGLSREPDTVKFVHTFLKEVLTGDSKKPCIIDADALNAIADNPKSFPKEAEHIVLTPHPKELSRLMGNNTSDVQANRVEAARKAATKFGCTVVLKGAHTVIASPDDQVYLNPTGNAGMATAGAGDVLSGIVGALLAQGLKPFQAAAAGAYLHGFAGDIAAAELGEAGIIAGDIRDALPLALSALHSGEPSAFELQLMGCEEARS